MPYTKSPSGRGAFQKILRKLEAFSISFLYQQYAKYKNTGIAVIESLEKLPANVLSLHALLQKHHADKKHLISGCGGG